MSSQHDDISDAAPGGPRSTRALMAAADMRAEQAVAAAIDDFFLSAEDRLDDQMRSALAGAITDLIAVVDIAFREHAACLLADRGDAGLAKALASESTSVQRRLTNAGLLRDTDFMREMIARVRQDIVAAALPPVSPEPPDSPSLLVRLTEHRDGVIATRAMALMTAEARRRSRGDGTRGNTDLSAELHHRLVWWTAAAIRERNVAQDASPESLDRAIVDAAARTLSAHDEGERLEAAAMRLSAAIDASSDTLTPLLLEALGDGRLALFIASLAHAIGIDYDLAREIVLDPDGERLWLVLRALDLKRDAIARIGLSLCEADARRDVEGFVDRIDTIAAIDRDQARSAIAPLTLHPDYRAALLALARKSNR